MSYDLIVLGSGPAGQKAALTVAKAGLRAIVVEKNIGLGGACVVTGTLPSKSIRESAYRWAISRRGIVGRELSDEDVGTDDLKGGAKAWPDMTRLMKRYHRVTNEEMAVVKSQFSRNNIEVRMGHGRITGPNQVEVESADGSRETLEGRFILIATGATPITFPPVKVDGKRIHDSNTLLGLKEFPKRLIVLGAGVIGIEYASIFLMAGSEVTVVDRRDDILSFVDTEVLQNLRERLDHFGIQWRMDTQVEEVEIADDEVRIRLANGEWLEGDHVLCTMARAGNTKDLGLESVGIKPNERNLIEVNGRFRTSVPTIYAAGDVIGFPALASTSMEQGRVAIFDAFKMHRGPAGLAGLDSMPKNYPYGIYTIPELSMIGETEQELKARGAEYVAGIAKYREVARGLINGDPWGMLKLLIDQRTLQVLGVHVVGDGSADLVHIGQSVMNLGGDVRYFISNVFNYPTFAEAYKTAALDAVNRLQAVPTGIR